MMSCDSECKCNERIKNRIRTSSFFKLLVTQLLVLKKSICLNKKRDCCFFTSTFDQILLAPLSAARMCRCHDACSDQGLGVVRRFWAAATTTAQAAHLLSLLLANRPKWATSGDVQCLQSLRHCWCSCQNPLLTSTFWAAFARLPCPH